MKLKFSAVLLSSVLVSASFASSLTEPCGLFTEQPAQTQLQGSFKVVPDSFEGVGEFRARRAALESRLQSFQDQKLKVFTPEIFAEMLGEGIQVAELGLHIFGKLPAIAGQINERLASFESRVKSKNALISWRDLVSLVRENNEYLNSYWEEFKFDVEFALRNSNLQPQVVAAHEYTLDQSERWEEIIQAWQNVPAINWHEYVYKVDACKDVLGKLVKHKFDEERDESIARAVDFFRSKLEMSGIGIRFDISHKKFCDNNPKDGFEKWLKSKVLNEPNIVLNEGIFRTHDFVVQRELLASYVEDSFELTEWIGVNDYASKVENTKFYEDRLINGESIELLPVLNMSQVYAEVRAKVETVIQTAFDETFEWLIMQ